jgi:hypothetical protein
MKYPLTSNMEEGVMSNHLSGGFKFPGDDARLDLTDVFAFVSPEDSSKTVLIIDVNPFMTEPAFHPDAVYRINIDNDGDAHADVAFTVVFSKLEREMQTATVYLARGRDADQPEPAGDIIISSVPVGFDASAHSVMAGPCRLFIGERSDPFFADAEGALHGFNFTGQDAFAGKNVLSIAIEVPNEILGPSPLIGVWAEVSLRGNDGRLVQMDRGGHPSLTLLNGQDVKMATRYNAGQPADDRQSSFVDDWSQVLETAGGYSPDEAREALLTIFPDILQYDRSMPATYPNGRIPTDDVFDARLSVISHGKISSDGVGPHTDLLPQFPFLGMPNAAVQDEKKVS